MTNTTLCSKLTPQQARKDFDALVRQVIGRQSRVCISCEDAECILISKTELDSLEKALEICARSESFRAVSNSIAHLTAANATAMGAVNI